jgi:hypothetical protein
MAEAAGSERLSDEEFERMRELFTRYCSYELDQWEMWRVETAYGPVYVNLSRAPYPDTPLDAYQRL